MPETITLTHTPTNCAAKAAGICDRVHVGDTVQSVFPGSGDHIPGRVQQVLDGHTYIVEYAGGIEHDDMTVDTLGFYESELEVL